LKVERFGGHSACVATLLLVVQPCDDFVFQSSGNSTLNFEPSSVFKVIESAS
jgi:hypothetical protein